MRWEGAKALNEVHFQRLTGVKRAVFQLMTEAPEEQRRQKRRRSSGRKPLLCSEDQILLLPGYYREYRTQLALGADFGLSESRTSTLIREVEGLLLRGQTLPPVGKEDPAH